MGSRGPSALRRARLPLLVYLACLLLPCGLALEPIRLESALGVQATERRKLGGTEFVLAYTDEICGGYPQQLANPFTAPTIEDVIFGGIRDFTALGAVKGIDLSFTDAYVDKATQTYYPRGVYELALYYNDYPSPPGARIPLLPRVAGRRNALTTLPVTAAALDMSQLGKFADKGSGSLQSATVCCSDDNMFESVRAVRQMIGDTKIGLPVCTGYPVEIKRPAAFPLWAGVRLTVQQPIGSNEYVVASIQFIWASDTPTPVALPPPSPPDGPAALPSVNPPFLPKGASPDWLAIATGVISFQLMEPTVSIIMTKRSFPIANSDIDQTVIAATRVNRGAAVALASENMLQHCCGGALSASAKQLNATAKGLDLLVLQGALWAAWYWVKTGAVRRGVGGSTTPYRSHSRTATIRPAPASPSCSPYHIQSL
ncbi:hypothetical protein HXX76_005772 [Chlamydomonas incerta]|uniref:Uncharacterized protein n=1 Tax=Chlamydomonas incerta TaxID=51695 RepID=A0A835TG96_CHLIN|nr:hypothetical protein HXX76_005772 [Chlamydomonas incerta]|eukprot:KAG2438165.1 hypothetical protein HXX76_005772 [Chlamydomonas incerta]